MAAYVRPTWTEPVFHDADGRPFTYGNRWGDGSPPEDTYSVDSHPERFAPLHAVADALMEHLVSTYDARADDDPAVAGDLLHPRPGSDIVRAVRLTPSDPDAAVVTFVWTAYPGVVIHAGLLHDLPYPVCGCDACDETATYQAEEMERHVRAITTGAYRERVVDAYEVAPGRFEPWIEMSMHFADGDQRSGGVASSDVHRLSDARRRLASLPNGWHPWPRR